MKANRDGHTRHETIRAGNWKSFINNIISGTAGGRKFRKKKHIEPIEMKRLWFDVTHLFEEVLKVLANEVTN